MTTVNRPQPGDARMSGWQDEQAYRLKKQARDKADAPPPSGASGKQVEQLGVMFSGLVGRAVSLLYLIGASVEIRQRCVVCGDDTIKSSVPDTGTLNELTGAIGTAVRISYLKHRCPPIEQSLLGATYEELDEMFAACERDGQRLMDRAAEVSKLRKARKL